MDGTDSSTKGKPAGSGSGVSEKPASPERVGGSLRPLAADRFGVAQARHLLWRAGFGGNESQAQALASMGPERAVDLLLDQDAGTYERPAGDAFDKDIMRPATPEEQRIAREARQRRDEDLLARVQEERQRRERLDRSQIDAMQQWWLKRMIETPRPLEEKIALFWHGHFATNYRSIENSYHMFLQNQLFRTGGLGSVGDLLRAIIRDPAMLAYLNNNTSRKNKPNENLARELMELFSLGVGNYREDDIKEGARALTGHTFRDDDFYFDKGNHDNGIKTILGRNGALDGDAFVEAILAQPACAGFIAARLYHFFVGDVPSEERGGWKSLDPVRKGVVGELGNTLRSRGYELRPMLRRLFLSEHFYEPGNVGQQIKSPAQLVVGAVRSLGTPVRDLRTLNQALDMMGQRLFFPPSVKGWDGGRSWINTSTLFVRQNVSTFLLTGKKPQGSDAMAEVEKYDPSTLLAGMDDRDQRDPERVVERLLRVTLGDRAGEGREAAMAYLRSAGGKATRDAMVGVLLLATAMPEYQLC